MLKETYLVPEYEHKISFHFHLLLNSKQVRNILTKYLEFFHELIHRTFHFLHPGYAHAPLFLSLFLRQCPALFSRWCRIHPVFPSVPFPILEDLSRRDASPLDRSKSNPRFEFILVAECDPFNGITRLRRSKLFTTPVNQRGTNPWTRFNATRSIYDFLNARDF